MTYTLQFFTISSSGSLGKKHWKAQNHGFLDLSWTSVGQHRSLSTITDHAFIGTQHWRQRYLRTESYITQFHGPCFNQSSRISAHCTLNNQKLVSLPASQLFLISCLLCIFLHFFWLNIKHINCWSLQQLCYSFLLSHSCSSLSININPRCIPCNILQQTRNEQFKSYHLSPTLCSKHTNRQTTYKTDLGEIPRTDTHHHTNPPQGYFTITAVKSKNQNQFNDKL